MSGRRRAPITRDVVGRSTVMVPVPRSGARNPFDAPPEAGFQAAVVQYARLMGWTVGFTWKSIHSPYGEPDLRMIRVAQTFPYGETVARLVWAECKTDDLKRSQPTGEQYEWLEMGRHVEGLECYLWRPSDWDEIQEVLK